MAMMIPQRVRDIFPPQFDVINARAARWREKGAEVLSLGQAVPYFAPPQCALDAASYAISNPQTHIYSADAGMPELREAFAGILRSGFGATVDPDHEMIITAGGNQAFMLGLLTLLEHGDEVILPTPFFMNHEMAVRAVGGVPVEAPLSHEDGFRLTIEKLLAFVTNKTKAVVIVSPSNPTGAVCGKADLTAIAETLTSKGIFLIGDETYMQFLYEGEQHAGLANLPDWQQRAIVTGSFSKSYGITGWRLGYLLAHKEIIEEALKLQDTMIICAPVITQIAVLAAFKNEWDYPKRYLEDLNGKRCYLAARLKRMKRLSWMPTKGGFFAFVRVDGLPDDDELSRALIDSCQLVTIPGSYFGKSGRGFIRLSYGSVSMEQLEKACDRLEGYFS